MAIKSTKKRAAKSADGPNKKRKTASGSAKADVQDAHKAKQNGRKKDKGKEKEKASDRTTIPIPSRNDDDDVELSDEDLDLLEEYGSAVSFLQRLDEKGISRSKKETERLHRLNKPVRATRKDDDLPSVDSHDEDEGSWSSGLDSEEEVEEEEEEAYDSEDDSDSVPSTSAPQRRKHKQHDEEMPYETLPRKRRPSWDSEPDQKQAVERLPIKRADGRIEKSGEKIILRNQESEDESTDDEKEAQPHEPTSRVEDVSTGARFGRPAVIDVVGRASRKARIQGAQEQIAGICQEIISDPENSLGLLRRLHTFSLPEISTPSHPEPVKNDDVIRRLTMLSQLAVFKDIIPGYRIRALTDKEKAEKVSQMVQRTRDWEQGLVGVYQSYLRSLETEIKAKSELAPVALHCMCTLLVDVTHFNFRVNLMSTIVACLSRKSWDQTSDLCLNAIIKVLRADNTGEASLEVVRLLNRMIKERKFNVHPDVLSCLLHLRLKTELSVRASRSRADKEDTKQPYSKGRAAARRAKGKATDQPHLSKKAKKILKEKKEIQKEMHEAEAEVDKEERAVTHTETLKLLFVLYFRILKNPQRTPLLPAALQGISKFSHLVNIDFFKDLLSVLKGLMTNESSEEAQNSSRTVDEADEVRHSLLCIGTAFELLTGQGEALDIDLTGFINGLYAIIPSLCLIPDIEASPATSFKSDTRTAKAQSTADLLFRALQLVFTPRGSTYITPAWRSAAFAKRLLTASLHLPPATAVRAITFVNELIERDNKLEALLSTEDRSGNGIYRPDIDDPQLSNPFETSFWELLLLLHTHWDAKVRAEARKLLKSAT